MRQCREPLPLEAQIAIYIVTGLVLYFVIVMMYLLATGLP